MASRYRYPQCEHVYGQPYRRQDNSNRRLAESVKVSWMENAAIVSIESIASHCAALDAKSLGASSELLTGDDLIEASSRSRQFVDLFGTR